jgi:hypothetical protein
MRLKTLALALAIVAPVAMASTSASAGAVVTGFNTSQLARNDDGSTGLINVQGTFGLTGLNFFGTNYVGLFVNNNGNVTFNLPLSTFTPSNITGATGRPIIAPFFADVDTRNLGSGITSYGTGTFAGHNTFGVTWPAVGYYETHVNRLNTFQLLLTERNDTGTGNFDIYFNYDQIQWETGDASSGSNGLGGVSALAGYGAGTGAAGSSFQLPGSLVNGAFLDGGPNSLVANSNIGVSGRYLFTVRSGQVAPGVIPEPATWAIMIMGFGAAGAALRRRRTALA